MNRILSEIDYEIVPVLTDLIFDKQKAAQFEDTRILNLSNSLWTEIKADAFEPFRCLETLNLSNNLLTRLETGLFSATLFLIEIDLARNSLDSLPADLIKWLPFLVRLDLSRNSFRLIPDRFLVSGSLQTLNLNSNDLQIVGANAFDSCLKLTELDLSDNRLEKLSGHVPNLTVLKLDRNPINTVRIVSNSLRCFSAEQNSIQDLNSCLNFSNRMLVELSLLNDVHWISISYVSAESFNLFANLRILKLTVDNHFDFGAIVNLKQLEVFHLVYTGFLDLAKPKLSIGDYLCDSPSFKTLSLTVRKPYNSYIKRLDQIKSLENYHLKLIAPEPISFGLLCISTLFRTNINLKTISVENLKFSIPVRALNVDIPNFVVNLQNLTLNGLRNKTINDYFDRFPYLEYLNLSKSLIEKFHVTVFLYLKFLKYLIVDESHLKLIQTDLFLDNTNLLELSLASNQITKIEDYAFYTLKKLQILNLRGNPLRNLSKMTFFDLFTSRTNVYLDNDVLMEYC